jgi:hypothetical protein
MKKEKRFRYEYLVIALMSLYIIGVHLYYHKKFKLVNIYLENVVTKYSNLDELKNSIELEEMLNDRNLINPVVVDKENRETTLHNVLDSTPNIYDLVILISLESCSTCRDQTLKVWNDVFEENSNLSIIILVAEDRELNKSDLRKVKAYMIGMDMKIPYYLSADPLLYADLGVTPKQTPLSLIVNNEKTIILANQAGESTLDRVSNFSKLFESLNAKGGEQ